MPDIPAAPRLTVTPAAHEAISRLRAARGGLVMFVQSGGCCAGSTPMCFPDGELVIGDIDVLLGDIDGCPFYIDAHHPLVRVRHADDTPLAMQHAPADALVTGLAHLRRQRSLAHLLPEQPEISGQNLLPRSRPAPR